jgi:hypothetical protein
MNESNPINCATSLAGRGCNAAFADRIPFQQKPPCRLSNSTFFQRTCLRFFVCTRIAQRGREHGHLAFVMCRARRFASDHDRSHIPFARLNRTGLCLRMRRLPQVGLAPPSEHVVSYITCCVLLDFDFDLNLLASSLFGFIILLLQTIFD